MLVPYSKWKAAQQVMHLKPGALQCSLPNKVVMTHQCNQKHVVLQKGRGEENFSLGLIERSAETIET